MTRTLLAALLVAASAHAQDDALASTSDRFEADLALVTRVAATAALVHDADGTFPMSAFGLLGSRWAGQTDLRAVPLSSLILTDRGDAVQVEYVPLPTDPYVREDLVVTLTLTPEGSGRYRGAYEIRRRADAEDGARPLPYDIAARYRVERAYGTLCVEAERIRGAVADGSFEPDPTQLSSEPLTIRVHPPGEGAPVFYERTHS